MTTCPRAAAADGHIRNNKKCCCSWVYVTQHGRQRSRLPFSPVELYALWVIFLTLGKERKKSIIELVYSLILSLFAVSFSFVCLSSVECVCPCVFLIVPILFSLLWYWSVQSHVRLSLCSCLVVCATTEYKPFYSRIEGCYVSIFAPFSWF